MGNVRATFPECATQIKLPVTNNPRQKAKKKGENIVYRVITAKKYK